MSILRAAHLRFLCACGLALVVACTRKPPAATSPPPSQDATRDAGADAAPFAKEPLELLLRAAQLADEQGDVETTIAIGKLVEARLLAGGSRLRVRPLVGLFDPLAPDAEAVSAIAADGSRAVVGHGHALSIVDFMHGVRLRPLAFVAETIRQVEISSDGRSVAVEVPSAPSPTEVVLRLYRPPLATPLVERTLPAPSGLQFSADGALLLVTVPDGSGEAVEVIECVSGRLLQTLKFSRKLLLLTTRFDGTLIAAVTGETEPKFYVARTGVPLPIAAPDTQSQDQRCHDLAIGHRATATLSPDRQALLTSASDSLACLWNLAERRLRRSLSLRAMGSVTSDLRALLPSGNVLVVDHDGHTALYDLRPPRPLRLAPKESLGLLRHGAGVVPLHDGGTLLLTQGERTKPGREDALQFSRFDGVRLVRLGQTDPSAPSIQALFGPVATSGDGLRALYVPHAPGTENAAVLFSVPGAAEAGPVHVTRLPLSLPGAPKRMLTADFLEGDRRLAVIDARATLVLFDMPGGAVRFTTPPAVLADQGIVRLPSGTLRIELGGEGYSTVGEVPDLARHLVCLHGAQPLPFSVCEKALRRSPDAQNASK